jgi:hypothetical protein
MLDKERNFIRVFRSDSPMRPPGKVLWEGDGLKKTYSEMVRLNKERRPVPCYYVCSAKSARSKIVYKVFKSTPPKVWDQVSMHTAYNLAVESAKRLRGLEKARIANERKDRELARAAEKAYADIMLARLRRAGVVRKKVPKLTAKDLRYLEWLESRRELIEDAA